MPTKKHIVLNGRYYYSPNSMQNQGHTQQETYETEFSAGIHIPCRMITRAVTRQYCIERCSQFENCFKEVKDDK